MALKNLKRNDTSIAKHVTRNATVEDLQRSVITGIGEKRVPTTRVELDGTNSLAMVAEGLVRAWREVQIVPEQTAIVRTDDDVVASRGAG